MPRWSARRPYASGKEYIPNQQTNYYQVRWEPDPGPPTQWTGTDADFVELYRAPGRACTRPTRTPRSWGRRPKPQHLQSWLERLAPLGFTKYLDGVSCHGYYIVGASSALPPEPGNLPSKMQPLRKTMESLMAG